MKVLITAISIFLFSCREINQTPTFVRYNELRDTDKISPYSEYEHKRKEHLNLSAITSGVDSFELRFWTINGESFGGIDLFIIKYDTTWKAFHYFLDMIVEPNTKRVKVLSDSSFLVKEIYPLTGWKSFVDSLNQFRLDTIPTQDSIPGFALSSILDAPSYEAEIATKNYYRRLKYHSPETYTFKQSKIFSEFVEMMIRQLGNDPEWFGWPGHYE